MKPSIHKIAFSILTAVLVFLGAELSLRILNPDSLAYYRNLKLLHRYHPEYRVGLAPNADIYIKHHLNLWEGRFTTNSLGYRGSPEVEGDKGHLACIGDSIVMGFGVSDQDTFCARIDGIQLGGREYQAFNLGVDAFGSMGYLKRVREAAERIPLDTVLLFVSPNDFIMADALRARGVLSDDETDAIEEIDTRGRLLFRIQFEATRYSYALMAAKLAIEQLRIKKSETYDSVRTELSNTGLFPERDGRRFAEYITGVFYRRPPEACSLRQIPETEVKKTFCEIPLASGISCRNHQTPASERKGLPEITRRSYDEMIRLSHERGFRLIPIMLPIQRESFECGIRGGYTTTFDYAMDMRDFFVSRGIKVIDLQPHIKDLCAIRIRTPSGYERGLNMSDILIPNDGHLTAEGNEWVGRALTEELNKLYP
jgi:hypothetical protein